MKISTTWSSSRMATRVSWPVEEMIISLFMQMTPRCAAIRRLRGARVRGGGPGPSTGQPPREERQHEKRHQSACLTSGCGVRDAGRSQERSIIPTVFAPSPRVPRPDSVCKTSHPHVQDEAKAGERGDERRAAVTHERQRDALDRREAGRHRHVVDHLERKPRNDASYQIGSEAVLGETRRLQRTQDDEQVQSQGDEHSDEALLFGKDREDEIVVRDRQELVLPLRALPESLAGQSARANRDARLDRLIAGAAWILLGIDEHLDARALVI